MCCTELLLFLNLCCDIQYTDYFFRKKKVLSSLVFNLQKLLQDTLVNIRSKMLGRCVIWFYSCSSISRLTFKCCKFFSFTAQQVMFITSKFVVLTHCLINVFIKTIAL